MDRLQLHDALVAIQGNDHVYFQPPPNVNLVFPCIIYHVGSADSKFADNAPYRYSERFEVTCVDKDPDCPTRFQVARLPSASFQRWYPAKNLNHYVYNLYI